MPSAACRRRRYRRAAPILAAMLVGALACTGNVGPETLPSGQTPTVSGSSVPPNERPNIVLVLTDDQRWDSLADLPAVQRLLVERGTTFTNAFTTDPLCCPSRASILTGAYPHTTGVYRNSGKHGGWAAFRRAESSTIATWLHDAGYRTAMFGKYFNGYRTTDFPPGWDRIMALISSGPGYFDYTVNDDGESVLHAGADDDYATDVFADAAVRFIRTAPVGDPLFLYFAPSAPHLPAIPAPRHANADVGRPIRSPAVNEADVSDKPDHIATLRPLGSRVLDEIVVRRARSLLAVDDAVAGLIRALRRSGRLENTIFEFSSDNGLAVGEHRWRYKLTPYEESIRVPLVIRYDALPDAPAEVERLSLNIDLAPTFADIAGVTPGSPVEGRSLLPVLMGRRGRWRRDFLIENLVVDRRGEPEIPTYCGVRGTRWKLVRYVTGELELYDLEDDPFELENLAAEASRQALVRRLDERLRELCAPPPPGFSP